MNILTVLSPGRLRKGRRRARLIGDLAGGIIAALIALPYGLAMASLMGLPPVMGIYTSILTAPFVALLGRNPVLIGGTASATVPFIAQAVHAHGASGAALLVLLSSLLMIALALARAGRHMMRVPHAVVSGFSCGIGGLMLVSQLYTLLGIAAPAGSGFVSPASTLVAVSAHLGEAHAAPLLIGVIVILSAAIAALISPRVPAPLIGLLLGIAAAQATGFRDREVGAITASLPPLLVERWSLREVIELLPSAAGLAFVASINILITSRVVEHFRGRHRRLRSEDADAELFAFGIGNCVAGLFGAPPSVGIPARSLAVVKCGGATSLANLFHAAVLVTILWLGAGAVSHIPLSALAGITAWMGIGLLNWSTWRRLPKMRRVDAAAFLLTAISVLFVSSVLAVVLGCSLYLIPYLLARRPAAQLSPAPVAQDAPVAALSESVE